MEGGSGVAEAERWLVIAEKLLAARDLHGTRTFALRARESDPRYEGSSQILAIADTLIAAESPVNGHPDWYAVLQLVRGTPDRDLIAAQHRKLTNLLNPVRNKLAFADLALKLVAEAWSVLSDPVKKSIYDDELQLIQLRQNPPNQPPPADEPIPSDSTKPAGEIRSSRAEIRPNRPEGASFWTACPYCYVLFEYPKVYEECTLRCQNCRRAFHAAVISPPPAADGEDSYFCSWGFFPLGVSGSGNAKATGGSCNWSPISPMFACPPPKRGRGRPRKNPRPDPPEPDVLIEIPESSDDDFVDVDDDDDDDDDDYDEEDDHDDAEWEFGNKKKDKNGKAKRKGLVGRPPKNAHKKREEIS